jgi:peptidoglycan/LPS O-acetylase OafA/YrhL
MALALLSATGARPARGRIWRWVSGRPTLAWPAAGSLFLASCFAFGLPRSSGQSGIPNGYSGLAWLGEHVVYGAIAVGVVLPATHRSTRTLAARILLQPPLPWLGVISYGIFLWHVPLMTYLCFQHPRFSLWLPFSDITDKLIVSTTTSILAAAVSYYIIERPFLRLKDGRGGRLLLRRRKAERDEIRVGVVNSAVPGSLPERD